MTIRTPSPGTPSPLNPPGGTERRPRWQVFLEEVRQDVAYGLRQLARAPGFAAIALLTLAAGIGTTAAIFSVVEGVVLRPFPFAHPERVVTVSEVWRGRDSNLSVGNFVDLLPAAGGFAALAATDFAGVNLAGGDRPERVLAAKVGSPFFAVFGVRPLLGRTFTGDEDRPGAEPVVVLSAALWRQHLGADPGILGRPLHLSGRVFKVIGVMPDGFDPTLSHEELWLPIAFTPAQRAQHDDHYLSVVGLLRPGVSPVAAQAALTAAMIRIAARYPQDDMDRKGVRVKPLADGLIGSYRQRLLVLLGAVGMVLLIACTNVANLLLARGSARGKELAIRVAIGARGARIARQLLTESAVLALAGGALGAGLALLWLRLFVKLAPAGIPRLAEARIDGGVLLFTLALSIGCSLLFGLAPALRALRPLRSPRPLWPLAPPRTSGLGTQGLLRGTAAGAAAGPRGDRMRSGLVAGEIALALTLLVGAGLLIRSALFLQRTPAGFDTSNLLVARVTLPEAVYPRPETVARTFAELADRVAQAPGVRAAAAVSAAPLGPGGGTNGLLPEGKPLLPENLIEASFHQVTPGYFAALRIPLLRGRAFTADDVAGRERVMIVSRDLARRTWGDADPIGKRIACCEGGPSDPRWKTVVGVVGDVRSRGAAREVGPEFYLPAAQAPAESWTWVQRTMTLVARGGDPGLLAAAMRSAVRAVDPALPLAEVRTMNEAVRGSLAEARFHTALLLVLGALGLGLAAVGVYGVVAYLVSLRTQEIGIRIALGARREQILLLLARQGAPPLALGLLAGTCGALAGTRWLQGSLYGVTAADPLTFGCAIAVLAAAGGVAVLLPALAATRIDPTRAIRGS